MRQKLQPEHFLLEEQLSDLYNSAITASILAWGGTPDQAAATICAQPNVAYATATGTLAAENRNTGIYCFLCQRS